MKKLFLALALAFCAATVSAQGWGLGARVGAALQLQGEYTFSQENYIDARLGLNLEGGMNIDLTLIHQWNVAKMDWTPSAGTWFVDLGVGAEGALFLKENGGIYAGVVGDAKFGIKFNKVPVKLAIDYTPGLGFLAAEDGGLTGRFINFGLSCVYCF